MKRFNNFLEQTQGVTNKDELITTIGVVILAGMAIVYNYKLCKERLRSLDRDREIRALTHANEILTKGYEKLENLKDNGTIE